MATSTTNLGLTKPAGTDKIRIAQINGNMDILDEKIGAVGNTSLQAQVTSQNEAISKITIHTELTGTTVADFQNALLTINGQMSNGEERAISVAIGTASGVFKQMTYYGTVIRSTSTRLIVSLQTYSLYANQKIIGTYSNNEWTWNELALKSELSTTSPTVTKTANIKTNSVVSAKRNANVVSIYMDVYAVSTSSEYVSIASLSEAPSTNVYFVMIDANDGAKMCRLTSNGELQIHGTVADRNYMGSVTYIVNS